MPVEPSKKKDGVRWKQRQLRNLKYVDDGMILAKLNMDSALMTAQAALGKPIKSKHDLQ